jgi:hypothetical protein
MHPQVSAHPGSVSDITSADALKGFDLVFVTQQPLSSMRRLDELASAAGVKYMAAAVVGAHSYFFLNLHSYTYMPKVGRPLVVVVVAVPPACLAPGCSMSTVPAMLLQCIGMCAGHVCRAC